jgi:hypothetical protein
MTGSKLMSFVSPIIDFIENHPVDAQLQYDLSQQFHLSSLHIQHFKNWCVDNIQNGSIRMRGPDSLRFGNLLKGKMRIDIVDMTGVGPGHTHPNGEVNLSFATENLDSGCTSFDGQSEGWLVKYPGSWHKPTVSNGRMIIVYFLPRGAILFD